jgi:hypothetical protein
VRQFPPLTKSVLNFSFHYKFGLCKVYFKTDSVLELGNSFCQKLDLVDQILAKPNYIAIAFLSVIFLSARMIRCNRIEGSPLKPAVTKMALIILCNPLDELVYGSMSFLDALYQPGIRDGDLANETSKRTTVVLKSLVLCKVVLLLAIACRFGIWHR